MRIIVNAYNRNHSNKYLVELTLAHAQVVLSLCTVAVAREGLPCVGINHLESAEGKVRGVLKAGS